MPYIGPAGVYQGLIKAGMSPTNAAVMDVISGQESGWNTSAESNYRPSSGDYFSTGLFQFNLGANYGPSGNIGLSGPGDIHGSQLQQLFGGQNPYYTLLNDPNANYQAAQWMQSSQGWGPWQGDANRVGWDLNQVAQAIGMPVATLTADVNQALGGSSQPGQGGGGGGPGPLGLNNNQPGQDAAAAARIGLQAQAAIQQKLQQIDDLYAQQSAQFQDQLLMMNEASLQIQEQALGRREAEAPIIQAEVQKQYGLEYAGIKAEGASTNRQYRQSLIDQSSQGAATGSSFTKGARDEHANTMADWSSAISGLQRQRATLESQQFQESVNYMESIAAMQDQQKQFDIQAQKYGISAQEIQSRLQASLGQINSGAALSVADIMTQIAGIDASWFNNISAPPVSAYPAGTTYGVGAFDPYANNTTGSLQG